MKQKSLFIFILLSAVTMMAPAQDNQNSISKSCSNPYDNPDPNRPLQTDPFLWENFPVEIDSSRKIKAAYKSALEIKDGYKILQLAKIEADNVYTYGNLVPGRMLHEAYNIAVNNKDPFLAFYITKFNSKYNFFTLVSPKDMVKKVFDISLERQDSAVLKNLAFLEESHRFNKEITPKVMRMKALFIKNENFSPYPNPYDNPDPKRPLDRSPFKWDDFQEQAGKSFKMDEIFNKSIKNHDGYKLLQLTKIELSHNYSKKLTPQIILQQAYNIAKYNKDPYLLLYISIFEKENNLQIPNLGPSEIIKESYIVAVERNDVPPLSVLYNYENKYDFLPDLGPKEIILKEIEIKKGSKGPLVGSYSTQP